jgi:hypothetical protein
MIVVVRKVRRMSQRTPRKGNVRPSTGERRAEGAASDDVAAAQPADDPVRASLQPPAAFAMVPPTVTPFSATRQNAPAATAHEVVERWSPEQCKAVLLAASRAGYLGGAFLEYFEAVAIDAATSKMSTGADAV